MDVGACKKITDSQDNTVRLVMSSIAKVFIILNFVLSVLFIGFAASLLSQQWDYRQMYLECKHYYSTEKENWESKEQQGEGQIKNLKELVNDRTRLAKQAQDKINDLEEKNKELQGWKDSLTQKMEDIKVDLKNINTTIKQNSDEMTRVTQEKETISKKVAGAEKDAKNASDELHRKVLELDTYKGRLAETEKMLKRSRRELWESKQIIRSVEGSGISIRNIISKAPDLEGQIVQVSAVVPIVMLSIGNDEKVQKGYQFTVYRGNRYIGQVVVEEVYPDMSAARIIKNMTKSAIKIGDKVTTKIGRSF